MHSDASLRLPSLLTLSYWYLFWLSDIDTSAAIEIPQKIAGVLRPDTAPIDTRTQTQIPIHVPVPIPIPVTVTVPAPVPVPTPAPIPVPVPAPVPIPVQVQAPSRFSLLTGRRSSHTTEGGGKEDRKLKEKQKEKEKEKDREKEKEREREKEKIKDREREKGREKESEKGKEVERDKTCPREPTTERLSSLPPSKLFPSLMKVAGAALDSKRACVSDTVKVTLITHIRHMRCFSSMLLPFCLCRE